MVDHRIFKYLRMMFLHLLVRESLADSSVEFVERSNVFLGRFDASRGSDGPPEAAGQHAEIGDAHRVELGGQRLRVSLAARAKNRVPADFSEDVVLAFTVL